jgi:hypothetical protein
MTTIIWCDKTKTMYADTQLTTNGIRSKGTKLCRHNDAVIGTSGDSSLGSERLAWFKNGAKPETFPAGDTACMLVATPAGLNYYHDRAVPMTITDTPSAIGSGSELAIMAMKLGLSAPDAIKKVSEMDVFTNTEVESMALYPTIS